jgi:preprotein translocase SecE subunit
MILKKWSLVFAQILVEAKKVDWFSKEDLLGAVVKVLVIVAIVSTVFLGIDWVISKSVELLLKI